ncbi:splicing factor Cactin-like [Oppia nitens]|uniref:splicing factor Cactin-like n=1 Tax=Oppia nitens TaxID=1686743 RepID=UPI0023D9A74B|nr:splicing factor Cactin-like [Oppia nitens]
MSELNNRYKDRHQRHQRHQRHESRERHRFDSKDSSRQTSDNRFRHRHQSRHRNEDKRDRHDHRSRSRKSRDRDTQRSHRSTSKNRHKSSDDHRRRRRHSSSSLASNGVSSVRSLSKELMSLSSSESSDEESRQRSAVIAAKVASSQMEILEERERLKTKGKEEKKRQKEIIKALETPEEKRLRRLAKKEAKERKRKQMSGWDEEYMGYTNADNPFGDSNLHKTFVWTKKYEKLGLKNVREEEIHEMNSKKMQLNRIELEKVKQRRLEMEREREIRDEEMSRLQREREADQFKEWEKQEDIFHLKQAKLRSKLRIRDGRDKPIDLLARYISTFGEDIGTEEDADKMEDMTADLIEPYMYLNGLRINDLDDLVEDIKVYMTLDSDKNIDFWKDLQIIVDDELNKLKKYKLENSVERREGINPAVSQDVVQVFAGKTPMQLQVLQTQIELKIRSNEEGIDIGYWESLLSRLKAHIARARLKELHEQNLKKQINRLEKQTDEPLFPIINNDIQLDTEDPTTSSAVNDFTEDISEQFDPNIKCVEVYQFGQYSPKMLSMSDVESNALIIEVKDDIKHLEQQRREVLRNEMIETQRKPVLSSAEQEFEREARKGMTDDEAVFSVEEQIKQIEKQYSWSDKYRPRKPRYFNRVHTGFEWNKYNQTHYDVDNPPPKVVQGYKFNIFYPDLIDKSKSPQFKITPCSDNKEFGFIRFTAGPPYEDICFKIVNREWNYSYKSGFRSQFHNNILQLWFHFKRYRYRR